MLWFVFVCFYDRSCWIIWFIYAHPPVLLYCNLVIPLPAGVSTKYFWRIWVKWPAVPNTNREKKKPAYYSRYILSMYNCRKTVFYDRLYGWKHSYSFIPMLCVDLFQIWSNELKKEDMSVSCQRRSPNVALILSNVAKQICHSNISTVWHIKLSVKNPPLYHDTRCIQDEMKCWLLFSPHFKLCRRIQLSRFFFMYDPGIQNNDV